MSHQSSLPLVASSLLLLLTLGCTGGTGSKRFEFDARIHGTSSNGEGGVYSFKNERGWVVTLERAQVTLGPVYLNVIPPLRGATTSSIWDLLVKPAWAHENGHLGAGRVVGEVLSQVSFDALSDAPVTFPTRGSLTQEEVRTMDIWFYPEPGTAADIKKLRTAALDIAGQAERGEDIVRFRGQLVLDDTWLANQTTATVGNQSILDIRQVRGIPASFFPDEGGALEISFHVERLLRGAEFSNLQANRADEDGVKLLVNGKAGDQVMTNLYLGLQETDGTYEVRWAQP